METALSHGVAVPTFEAPYSFSLTSDLRESILHRIRTAALAAGVAACALPAVADAAKRTVSAGPPLAKPPAGVPKDAAINRFFPAKTVIRAGDSVTFRINGFYPVNFVPAGRPVPQLAVADPTRPVSGANDAAGAPFWFNGQPSLLVNPEIFFGTKSGRAYTGTQALGSGAPMGPGAPKPWSVRFPKAGKYTYSSPVYPGMTGTVEVLAKGAKAKVPSARAHARRAKQELGRALDGVKKLAKASVAAGDTIVAGPDSRNGLALYRYTPAVKTVSVGKPVTLTMSPGTSEVHTFTFGRERKALEKISHDFIGPVPGTGKNGPPVLQFDPRAAYPSDQGALPAYDGTSHGDGFLNTGMLDADPSSPLPLSAEVVFSKPGTYEFLCLIHPEMRGKVSVRA